MIKVLVSDKHRPEWYRYQCPCAVILVVGKSIYPPDDTSSINWAKKVVAWRDRNHECPVCGSALSEHTSRYIPCTEFGVLLRD